MTANTQGFDGSADDVAATPAEPAAVAAPAVPRRRRSLRDVTMLNRKTVVGLAGILAMTVVLVSFALNPPQPATSQTVDSRGAAEDAAVSDVRPSYLASPPDTAALAQQPPAMGPIQAQPTDLYSQAGAYGGGVTQMDGGGAAMGGYPEAAPAPQAAVAAAPSARELEVRHAMRCGIRSCPAEQADESAGAADASGGSSGDLGLPVSPGAPAARDRFQAFSRAATAETSPYAGARIQRPISPYQIMAGTLIPVALEMAVNSDLPGEVVAKVVRNVYDSHGRYLLVPAGTKVLGKVDNQVGVGQQRVNIAWYRMIFPNNGSIMLPAFAGVDAQGATGLHGHVNNHYRRTYLNAILLSAITADAQLSQPRNGGSVLTSSSPGQVAAGSLGQELGEVSTETVRRNMQVGPTLELPVGFKFNIYVSKDLVLEPYDRSAVQ